MSIADRPPTLLSRLVKGGVLRLFKSKGWATIGVRPEARRYVLLAIPHTTNWDFIMFLGLAEELGVQSHFMGKTSLFKWPMRQFMFDMGGVPVDRGSSHDYVEQMVAEFGRRDDFVLTIAAEGTRSGVRRWKSGFYHIAMGAGVPIQLAFVDYEKKRGGFGPLFHPTGDYAADMEAMLDFYRSTVTNFPEPETAKTEA